METMFARWDEGLAVHVKHLDEQRRRLVRLLNEAESARVCGDVEAFHRTLQAEKLWMEVHHAAEERLLASAGLPVTDEHRMRHAALAGALDVLLAGSQSGTAAGRGPVLARWRDDLLRHLRLDDADEYARHLGSEERSAG
jgi:hemerythrin-like metal-binding protein